MWMRTFFSGVVVGATLCVAPLTASADAFGEGKTAYYAGDYAKALESWRPLAEQGQAQAQVKLGYMYEYGKGVAKDDAKAAEQGHVKSMKDIAFRYHLGKGVPKDPDEAVKWYRKWAEGYRKAAEQGDVEAQYELGAMYSGTSYKYQGAPTDLVEALKWYKKAAEQGHVYAQIALGTIYAYGEGVPQDYAEAEKWYRKAAEQKDTRRSTSAYAEKELMWVLGQMYAEGEGVPQDYAEAEKWYRKAAEQDHAAAQYTLGQMYARGEGVPQDYAEAEKWYRKAAKQLHVGALYALGWVYANVVKNEFEASKWWQDAVRIEPIVNRNPEQRSHVDYGYDPDDPVVAKIQAELARMGYDPGPVDGKFGNKTKAALEQLASAYDGIQLFGTPLVYAQRSAMRRTLREAGLRAERENNRYWYDLYDSSAVLKGSTKLAVGYMSSGGRLAAAEYTFPAFMDKEKVREVADMVASKYGRADRVSGNISVGPVAYHWERQGVQIKVHRGWPNMTTYLTYEVPEAKQQMDTEIAANERTTKAQQARAQSNAF